jgi:predicted RNA-binding Zn-ribbon protein involved in translation (DUF1610 family)
MAAFIWSPWDGFVPHDRVIHDTFLLTWSAKWAGEREVLSDTLTSAEALDRDDTRIAASIAELLREADVVVAHNGDRFDIPKLNGRLLQLGLEPLGPVRTIDTLKLAKRNIKVAFNKLDYLGEFLGLGKKIKTDWSLWERCYNGDEKALAEMTRYNKRDVVLLEQVFNRLKPYVRQLPRLHDGEGDACPSCGSHNLIRRGVYRTNSSNFPKMQCKDCGRYSRSRKADPEKLAVYPL